MPTKTFICPVCLRPLETDFDSPGPKAEYEKLYGHPIEQTDEPVVAICDDCYKEFLVWHNQQTKKGS